VKGQSNQFVPGLKVVVCYLAVFCPCPLFCQDRWQVGHGLQSALPVDLLEQVLLVLLYGFIRISDPESSPFLSSRDLFFGQAVFFI
jgi:hypothetical protein